VGSSLDSLSTASNTTWLAGTKQALVAAGAPSSVTDDLAIGSGSDHGNGGNNLDVGSKGACGSNNVRCVVPGVIGGVFVVGLAGFIAYRVAKRSKARNAYGDDARCNIQMDENITLERPMPSGSVLQPPGPARAHGDPDDAPLSFSHCLPGEVSVNDVQLQRPAPPMVDHSAVSDPSAPAAAFPATRSGQELFDARSPRDGDGTEGPHVGIGNGLFGRGAVVTIPFDLADDDTPVV
jgi:hypothetical protein